MEAEFRSFPGERLDAIVVSRAQGSRLLNATPWSNWSDVETSLDQWAEGFRKSVDDAR